MRIAIAVLAAILVSGAPTCALATQFTYSFSGTAPTVYGLTLPEEAPPGLPAEEEFPELTAAEAAYLGLADVNLYTASFTFDSAAPDENILAQTAEYHGLTATIDVNGKIFTGPAYARFFQAGPHSLFTEFSTFLNGDFLPDFPDPDYGPVDENIRATFSFQSSTSLNMTMLPHNLNFLKNAATSSAAISIGARPYDGETYVTAAARSKAAPTIATFVTSSVPESSSWMLMLAGFSGIGVALRRRSVKNAALAWRPLRSCARV